MAGVMHEVWFILLFELSENWNSKLFLKIRRKELKILLTSFPLKNGSHVS
jgi:hypothetical protein